MISVDVEEGFMLPGLGEVRLIADFFARAGMMVACAIVVRAGAPWTHGGILRKGVAPSRLNDPSRM